MPRAGLMLARPHLNRGNSGVLRAVAAAVAALALGGPILSTAHLTVIRHLACEHGDIVEVKIVAYDHRPELLADGGHQTAARLGPLWVRESSPEHSHCPAVAHRRDSAPPRLGAIRCTASPSILSIEWLRTQSIVSRSTPVYIVAPKNSPPV